MTTVSVSGFKIRNGGKTIVYTVHTVVQDQATITIRISACNINLRTGAQLAQLIFKHKLSSHRTQHKCKIFLKNRE